MPSRPRTELRGWLALAAMQLAVATAGCNFGAPDPKTVQGREVFDLYRFFVWAAIGVGGITYALILWSALRYRRRSEAFPGQTRSHVPLEITYTALPVLIVIVLFAATFRTEDRVDAVSPEPEVRVTVTAFQWQWRFEYPQYRFSVVGTSTKAPTMAVPAGQTVRVTLVARDVIHAFYVPDFLFKRDAIPGLDNEFDFVAPEVGRFRGECAEYCGLDHAAMTFFVEAMTPDAFRAWAADRAESGFG
jgi:cytochrome c oxidase subunit 2